MTRLARAALGAACLLWSGSYPALAGAIMPPETIHRVAAGTDQPDFAAYERRVEGLRRGLAGLDRIEGQYTAGDNSVTYVAFVDGAVPIVVTEHWTLGEYGRGEAVFHFMHGDLVRYRSRTRGLSNVGAPSDGWYERTRTLYFAPGRFIGGTGTINDRPAEPDEHEVRGAWRQAGAVKARVTAARAANVLVADPGRTRYACTDGAVFAATFDVTAARAVVEFLGASRSFCPRPRPVPASFTAMTAIGCAAKGKRHFGRRAIWPRSRVRSQRPRPPLHLVPGNYPLFGPAARSADDWSRFLFDLIPAISTCLREPVGDLPRVVKAWPMNHGIVGVRLQNIDGGRHKCIAAADGSAIDQVELLWAEGDRAPGEGNPIFTPADGAYPGGACFRHERVETADGRFLGWLSTRTC